MRQIAERLGLSEKTVENQIARAMVHCRQRLQDAGRDI
jgi:RNA polymerase sigma-70 factor (ECF subfamily)